MVVLRGGIHIDKDEEEWSARAGCWHISWDERCQIGWLLKSQHLESNCSNFKANSVANRKLMQIGKNRSNVAEPRFVCDHSSTSILDTLRGEWDLKRMCLSGECCRNQVGSSYGFRRLSSKRSPNVTQHTNMEKTKPCMFQTPAYQRTLLSQDKHPGSKLAFEAW